MAEEPAGHRSQRGSTSARYDGVAEWYDSQLDPTAPDGRVAMLIGLLGAGPGFVVDVGCGTGIATAALSEHGWEVVGVDLSRRELEIARRKHRSGLGLMIADAARLPIRGDSVDAVVSLTIHTDVDDWAAVVSEAARILKPGGCFVYVGLHPCFIGPFSELLDDGHRLLHAGYRDRRRVFAGPGIGDGIRSRVGVRHLPLSELINPLLTHGLHLQLVAESQERLHPLLIGLRTTA